MNPGDRPPVRSPAATKLVPRFMSHRERDVQTVRQALEKSDFETIARIGHNMRGNGRSYGFPDIGDIGEGMETAANTGSRDGVLRHVEELERWLAAHDELRQPVAGQASPGSDPASVTRVRAADEADDPGPERDDGGPDRGDGQT